MMNFLPEKLVREWSYRLDTGMPDLKNNLHLIELKNLLIERNFPYNFVDGLINNLKGELITEAATSMTEDVHETFTALYFGHLHKWLANPTGIKDLSSYEVIVNGASKLKDKDLHVGVGKKWFKNGKMNAKQKKLLKDGKSLASKINTFLGKHASGAGWTYSPSYVTRAFPSTSPKPVGDMAIGLKGGGYIDVSLKYGQGQFNSLSIADLLRKLYGIDIGKTRLLNFMYNNGYKSEIDTACNLYIQLVLGQYEYLDLGVSRYEQEHKDLIASSGLDMSSGWSDYKSKGTKTHKAFSRVYNHANNDRTAKKMYINTKRSVLNNAIDAFLKVGKNGLPKLQKNLADAISFIIRAEDNKSYLYASKAGDKMTLIPSKKQIKQVSKTFTLKVNAKTDDDGIIKSANYVQDIVVSGAGKELFTFDINWRFAGSGGQWSGDVDQKGAKFTFTDNFAKVFGLDKNPPVSD